MGLMPDLFWALTFAEFCVMAQGYMKRMKRKRNEMISTAWHTVALGRMQRLPALDSLIERKAPKRKQSNEEMYAMARMLNAMFGGDEVEV